MPPPSDHFNGKTFFQPGSHPARLFRDFLRWRFTSRPTPWPREVTIAPQPPPPAPRDGQIVATWLGHATYLVQTAQGNVLFDPVLSNRVSPFTWFGPRRAFPAPLTVDTLPRVDAVCVTHDHYDHFDASTLRQLARETDAVFVAPLRHRDLLERVGARRIVELDWWQSHRLPGGVELTLTPTKHWSNRLGTPRNFRLWGGFWMRFGDAGAGAVGSEVAIDAPGGRTCGRGAPSPHGRVSAMPSGVGAPRPQSRTVWFVGDSGFDEPLFREVRRRCGAPDVALVPIGAYEPRWFMAPMHMNPEESVKLHRDVGARVSLAMHWGTFQLTDEGREEPVRALEKARASADVAPEAFRVLAPGESVVV